MLESDPTYSLILDGWMVGRGELSIICTYTTRSCYFKMRLGTDQYLLMLLSDVSKVQLRISLLNC